MAQPNPAAEVARLDAEVTLHKREERRHRREAREAAQARDRLIDWCRERGIPIHKAQPERHGHDD